LEFQRRGLDSVCRVRESPRVLELCLVGSQVGERRRADLLVDRLASRRAVNGDGPRWTVVYDAVDITEAMRLCEAELTELDPRWFEVLDFRGVPARRLRDAEFG
jgi:hypothetical protein